MLKHSPWIEPALLQETLKLADDLTLNAPPDDARLCLPCAPARCLFSTMNGEESRLNALSIVAALPGQRRAHGRRGGLGRTILGRACISRSAPRLHGRQLPAPARGDGRGPNLHRWRRRAAGAEGEAASPSGDNGAGTVSASSSPRQVYAVHGAACDTQSLTALAACRSRCAPCWRPPAVLVLRDRIKPKAAARDHRVVTGQKQHGASRRCHGRTRGSWACHPARSLGEWSGPARRGT